MKLDKLGDSRQQEIDAPGEISKGLGRGRSVGFNNCLSSCILPCRKFLALDDQLDRQARRSQLDMQLTSRGLQGGEVIGRACPAFSGTLMASGPLINPTLDSLPDYLPIFLAVPQIK